jgi:glycogen debranching enzyme
MTIEFGREVCGFLPASERREWLVTNGIGGYASGTVAGMLTRRYHGLLIAALQPPLGRTLLLARFDEMVDYDGRRYELFTDRRAGGVISGHGYRHLERFWREGTVPVWAFACADALLEKRVFMARGANTTYIHYTLRRAARPLTLRIDAQCSHRDHHASTRAGDFALTSTSIADGLAVSVDGTTVLYLRSDRASAEPSRRWSGDHLLQVEVERGLDSLDAHVTAGSFQVTLEAGQSCTFVASTEPDAELDGQSAYAAQRDIEEALLETAQLADTAIAPLVLAADQFVVRRDVDDTAGHTILAGYPWFSDWGRDTMISLPGLTITTRRYETAASILRTFARFVDQGMLPNRFPDVGQQPEYNTIDATLWYFEAIRAYVSATEDSALVRELLPLLHEIIGWHMHGTRYNIHVDPADGLLNALWYHALRCLDSFSMLVGEMPRYGELAAQVRASFARFWNSELGCCFDVIDGPEGDDASIRPNQILAVSLAHSPLDSEQQRAVVDVCSRQLLTSHGLRSLSPDDPRYSGHFGGDARQRDSVYHQGTVWGWLIGPFVEAHLRVYGDRELARSFLEPLRCHMREFSLGTISEVFDGDPPFLPGGCFAQAWSAAEVLRAWALIEGR